MGTGDFEGPVLSLLRSRTAPPFLPLVGLAQEGPFLLRLGGPGDACRVSLASTAGFCVLASALVTPQPAHMEA